ncbi:MAG: SON protein [Desulfovibrio sp.]|jgi:hypothetical protein|nr:SON protein [Desulfovibrio sp.]
MRLTRLFLIVALLASCAGKAPLPAQETPHCQDVYVFAPGNYIVDIASGAEVVLDPGVQEFPLFCSPREARKYVDREMAAGRVPEGDWRVYRLDGTFDDLAQMGDNGSYSLSRLALAVDWVSDQ